MTRDARISEACSSIFSHARKDERNGTTKESRNDTKETVLRSNNRTQYKDVRLDAQVYRTRNSLSWNWQFGSFALSQKILLHLRSYDNTATVYLISDKVHIRIMCFRSNTHSIDFTFWPDVYRLNISIGIPFFPFRASVIYATRLLEMVG